jgi:hypothetical protein
MSAVAVMAQNPKLGARATEAPCYRLTDKRTGEEYDIGAEDLVCVVGVELSFIDWATETDGAFENGRWRVEASNPA